MTPFDGLQEALDWAEPLRAGDFCCFVQWQGFVPPLPPWRMRIRMALATGVLIVREPPETTATTGRSHE